MNNSIYSPIPPLETPTAPCPIPVLLEELIAVSQTTQDILITGILVIVLLLVAILVTKLI